MMSTGRDFVYFGLVETFFMVLECVRANAEKADAFHRKGSFLFTMDVGTYCTLLTHLQLYHLPLHSDSRVLHY